MSLSIVLSKLMKESNINDQQLANYTSVPRTTILRMRQDDKVSPKISSLKAMAKFFNISINQLLSFQKLPEKQQEGIHTTLDHTAVLLPVIDWYQIVEFLNNSQNFLKSKIVKWIASMRDFLNDAYAVSIPDNDRAFFLKEGSMIFVEPVNKIKKNGIALFLEEDKQISLYKTIVDGDDVYVKSINPEIKHLRLLHDSNMKLLGSIAEIRFALQGKDVDILDEERNVIPFYTKS